MNTKPMKGERGNPLTKAGHFTDKRVQEAEPPPRGQQAWTFHEKTGTRKSDPTLTLSISYGGTKTWRVRYYRNAKPSTAKLGFYPELRCDQAREAAGNFTPPDKKPAPSTSQFSNVAERWLKEWVEAEGLRTGKEKRRQLERYVLKQWGDMDINDITRPDLKFLLDEIAANTKKGFGPEPGRQQARAVGATLSSLMHWYADEVDDSYVPVTVSKRKHRRKGNRVNGRDRVLDDAEIKLLWEVTAEPTPYHGLIRMLLLTAQRLAKVQDMLHDDIRDGVCIARQSGRDARDNPDENLVSRRW